MRGLGIGRVGIELDRHRAIPGLSHPSDVDLSPGTPVRSEILRQAQDRLWGTH